MATPSESTLSRTNSRGFLFKTPSLVRQDTVQDLPTNPPVLKTDSSFYRDLGLGRGINVTDPDMWESLSHLQVRSDLKNIISTAMSGKRERYKTEVYTFSMQKQNLWLSLDNPMSHIKIEMDEQYSRSFSTTKVISGVRIHTRTIGFQLRIDNVLFGGSNDVDSESKTDSFESDTFENSLYCWIYSRNFAGESKAADLLSKHQHPATHELMKRLMKMYQDRLFFSDNVLQDCLDFVNNIGITHYVSAIKLGACYFSALRSESERKRLGVSAGIGVDSLAKGGTSGQKISNLFRRSEEVKKIGRIGNGDVVLEEAVIGFKIQPLDQLVRLPFVKSALRKAIKKFIQSKDSDCEVPFLISCEIDEKVIYLTVNKKYQLVGTESVHEAAPFYMIPTEDTKYPSDFYITYWGKNPSDRKRELHLRHPEREHRSGGPPLPHYLSTDTDILGKCTGPLSLKKSIEVKQARFSLHSRVQSSPLACMMCTSTPVSLKSWFEGEQFYLMCSHHSLKIDSYIAMQKEGSETIPKASQKLTALSKSQREKETLEKLKDLTIDYDPDPPITEAGTEYKSTTVIFVTGNNPAKIGTLFRLNSIKAKES